MKTLAEISAAAAGNPSAANARLQGLVERARVVDPGLHGFISIAGDESDPVDAQDGPLGGVALAVKDNVAVAGFTTTCGSAFFRERPEDDAPVVTALRASGASVVGKANLGEFAIDSTCQNAHFGAASNPWDPERIPGGSSGGSAIVVAAGMADLAVGTDAAGSVRIPAALCGVAGFRSGGAWGIEGIAGAPASIDSLGLLARTAEDVAYAAAQSGLVESAPANGARRRIAYLADESMGVAASHVWEQYGRAIDALVAAGWDLVPVSLAGVREGIDAIATIGFSELASCHRDWMAEGRPYGDGVKEPLETGLAISAVDYLAAQRTRAAVTEGVLEALDPFSHLLTPTMPITAPVKGETPAVAGDDDVLITLIRFTALANLMHAPAMSVFAGCASDGLPVGVQVMGRPGEDRAVIDLACDVDTVMNEAFATRRRLEEVMISWS